MDEHRELSKQVRAAIELRRSLAVVLGDDMDALRDVIEGETGLHEAIAGVAASIREDEILILGLDAMIDDLGARKSRIEARIAAKRAVILQAMSIGELKTLELPDVTLTVKAIPRALQIVDEALLPAEYWRQRDPVLDKRAIASDLKAGNHIPGALLDNGGTTLQLRRK